MIVKLPNGLLDGPDLFNYVEVEELTGKQQNYLANKDLVVGNIGHVPKILEDLVISLQNKEGLKWKGDIKEAIWKLPSGDIETILIKIREKTFGPKFYHEAMCNDPECQHINKNLMLKLDKLKLSPLSVKEMLNKKKRTFTLPKAKIEVEVKPLYLKELFDVIKITTNKKDELITSLVVLSIKRLGTKTPVTKEDVESLKATDIQYLQEKLSDVLLEGTIDTDVEVVCEKCEKEFTSKLNVFDSDFFALTKATVS